jgi:thiol-disulfide isomerase/thioredoxin
MAEIMNAGRRDLIRSAALSVAATQLGFFDDAMERLIPAAGQSPVDGRFGALGNARDWVNSTPLNADSLRGKVVLVEFWTYTCINWLRSLPYTRAWAAKYGNRGLVVIGVHTPEFSFEHELDNVRRAVMDLRVAYPVAVDNSYAIWRSFNNHYWPARYLVEADGRIRHHHFGEGAYDATEKMIQRALNDAGITAVSGDLVSVDARGVEAAADWGSLKSAENYVGYGRTQHFASPNGAVADQRRAYSAPARLGLNDWALEGEWTMKQEATVLHQPNGRITCRFHARDVHLVMGTPAPGQSVRFRVRIDDQPPGAAHGIDIDADGNGIATYRRLYQLLRQPGRIRDRQIAIEFLDAGVEAYAFTFG